MLQTKCIVDECMKRWRTVRDWYVRELKSVKKRKSGDDATGVYTPTWCFFNVLSFLMEAVRHRK